MIETEHRLVARGEDRNLVERFFGVASAANDLRVHREGRAAGNRQKSDTAVDVALSNECKRILAYAAEEAERLNHRHIGTEHLLLGKNGIGVFKKLANCERCVVTGTRPSHRADLRSADRSHSFSLVPSFKFIPVVAQFFIPLMGETQSVVTRANGRYLRLPDVSRFIGDRHMPG